MEQIQFEEKDEFVSVTAVRNEERETNEQSTDEVGDDEGKAGADVVSSQNTDELQSGNSNLDSGTVGDSVRTEPLEDDEADPSESQ